MKIKILPSGNRAFTLNEVLVTMAIIGIVSAIAIPHYGRYRVKSRRAEAHTKMSEIVTAQKALYTDSGSFKMWTQEDGLTAPVNPGDERWIGLQMVFNNCTTPPCDYYDYKLNINQVQDRAKRRNDDIANDLENTGGYQQAGFDYFVAIAAGDLSDDSGVNFGDVLIYNSRDNEILQMCDDMTDTAIIAGDCDY